MTTTPIDRLRDRAIEDGMLLCMLELEDESREPFTRTAIDAGADYAHGWSHLLPKPYAESDFGRLLYVARLLQGLAKRRLVKMAKVVPAERDGPGSTLSWSLTDDGRYEARQITQVDS